MLNMYLPVTHDEPWQRLSKCVHCNFCTELLVVPGAATQKQWRKKK